MTLEERIKQMLEESTKQTEVTQEEVVTESIMTRVADLIGSKEAIAKHVKDQTEHVANALAQHPSVANHPQKSEIVQKIKTHLGGSKNLTDFTKRGPGVIDILKSHGISKNASESLVNLNIEPLTEEDLDAMTQEELNGEDLMIMSQEELNEAIDRKKIVDGDTSDENLSRRIAKSAGFYHGATTNASEKIGREVAKKNHGDYSKHYMDGFKIGRSDKQKHDSFNDRMRNNKPTAKESSEVSSQVASLLEAEGLSEDFKVQAVTIFEAAVTDRVLQIQEELEAQYTEKLDEAKAEIETNIDGFLNEVVQQWAKDNEVAIQSSFKTKLAESFMDGLQSLLAEHNIDLPEESENALEIALEEVSTLEQTITESQETVSTLVEEINMLKAEKILESFKDKMTDTEFDRFVQLTESVKYKDETQYEKQLTVVLENFGKIKAPVVKQEVVKQEVVTEDTLVSQPEIRTVNSSVERYAQYLSGKKI